MAPVGRASVGDDPIDTEDNETMMELYTRLLTAIEQLKQRAEGISAIEYGLMAVLIALAFTVGAGLLGTALNTLFTNIATQLN